MKLNIGSSSCHLDGWINLEYDEGYWKKHKFSGERLSEKATRNMPDVFGDARKLNYPDNTFNEVRASHILEHLDQSETISTIKEWWRVLKVGGFVRIIVPDFKFFIDKWINREINIEWWDVQLNDRGLYEESELKRPFEIIDDALSHLIFLNGHHKAIFTYDLLKYYMEISGFSDIKRCEEEEIGIPDCTVCDYSLKLIGQKHE